jgi:hypothetical protein
MSGSLGGKVGVGSILHCLPFQRSTRPIAGDWLVGLLKPTVQAARELHDTAFR